MDEKIVSILVHLILFLHLSVGAYILAEYYYSHTQNRVLEGLGIFPIATKCHYKGKKETEDSLKKRDKELALSPFNNGLTKEKISSFLVIKFRIIEYLEII